MIPFAPANWVFIYFILLLLFHDDCEIDLFASNFHAITNLLTIIMIVF